VATTQCKGMRHTVGSAKDPAIHVTQVYMSGCEGLAGLSRAWRTAYVRGDRVAKAFPRGGEGNNWFNRRFKQYLESLVEPDIIGIAGSNGSGECGTAQSDSRSRVLWLTSVLGSCIVHHAYSLEASRAKLVSSQLFYRSNPSAIPRQQNQQV
jgi:hypothetical protein